jgi:SAM-dependent methyltransferase
VGLDFSPAMLEVAREAGEQEGVDIEWIESSADAMPFSEHEFDLVISQQGLQFFPDRVEAAKDIYRVLKPGGRLVASVWQGVERHPLWGKMFETVSKRLDAPLSAVALPFMMGDQSELRSYLEKGGFSEVSITEESLVLRFPEPGRFIQLSVAAAGAAIPALGAMDPETRKSVIAEIVETLSPEVAQNVNDGFVVMDSHLNQAIATK